MTELNRYRIWCTTDSKWEFIWAESEPSTCPADSAHTIDAAKTAIIGHMQDNEVKIIEESTLTLGNTYRAIGKKFSIPASVGWHEFDVIYKYPISIYSAVFSDSPEKAGDECNFEIAPETTIGALTAASLASDTTFTVSQTVIDNAKVGRILNIDDGTNNDNLGEIVDIDGNAMTIQTEGAATNAFAAGAGVKMTTRMVDSFPFEGEPVAISLGESVIGGSYVAENTLMKLKYYNSDGTAKTFGFTMEIKY